MFPMSTTQGNPRGKYIYSNATYKVTLEYLVILQTLLSPFARLVLNSTIMDKTFSALNFTHNATRERVPDSALHIITKGT